jgi:hypothetical protein
MLKQVLIIFFLLNSLFWGFAGHSTHCDVASKLGFDTCPPHWVHVWIMGLGSFAIALFLKSGFAGFIEFVLQLLKKLLRVIREFSK